MAVNNIQSSRFPILFRQPMQPKGNMPRFLIFPHEDSHLRNKSARAAEAYNLRVWWASCDSAFSHRVTNGFAYIRFGMWRCTIATPILSLILNCSSGVVQYEQIVLLVLPIMN